MPPVVLAQGFFPLTQDAADAALDAIDFIAAAVRGYDAIDVTDVVRPLWRTHLATWYPMLPPLAQHWYANAQQTVASIRAQRPLLNPMQRQAVLQMWANDLPYMLWMVEPVLAQAQALDMQEDQRSQLDDLRAAARPRTDAEAINELNAGMNNAVRLQNYATGMTANTLNLMNAMSGH
jgi:hypothetical protein